MNNISAASNPHFDGKMMLTLRDQISSAFELRDLKELVLLNFDQELERIIPLDCRSLDEITLSLLMFWQRRGALANLLRVVRKIRPEKVELLNAIAGLCPDAMSEPPSDVEVIEAVALGVNKLDEIRKDATTPSTVNDRLRRSRDEIKLAVIGLNYLKIYKNLHDALQRAQFRPYRELASKLEQLRINPEIADELQPVIAELKTISNKALQLVEALSGDKNKYAREKEWADDFAKAINLIGAALSENTYRIVKQGSMKIRSLLLLQQTHLNDEMRSCIRQLELEELIQLLDEIGGAPGLSDEQRPALADAKIEMRRLWDALRGRVAVHSKWQEVEAELWNADNASAKISSDSGEEFDAIWQNTREEIEPLWRQDPKADWVAVTQRFGKRVDDALGSTPADLVSAITNYGRFSTLARLQFQNEDTELKGLCEKLLRLRDPLSNLLSG
jgi:hypothetical protein